MPGRASSPAAPPVRLGEPCRSTPALPMPTPAADLAAALSRSRQGALRRDPPHCYGSSWGNPGGVPTWWTSPVQDRDLRSRLCDPLIDGGFSACVVQVPMLRYICKSSPTHPLGSSGGVSHVAGLRFPGRNYYVHDHHASSGCVSQQLYSHAIFATYQSGLAHGLGEVTAKALVLRLLYVRSH